MCWGQFSVWLDKGYGFYRKCFALLSNVSHICGDPRFLWHHHAIWNASCVKMLFRKFQHVPLPDLCPKCLVVTAPWGSYLPGCAKTNREPVYPFHPSATGCCGLLSYILWMICYFDGNCFNHKAVATGSTATVHFVAQFRFYMDHVFYWLLKTTISFKYHTKSNHKQLYCTVELDVRNPSAFVNLH